MDAGRWHDIGTGHLVDAFHRHAGDAPADRNQLRPDADAAFPATRNCRRPARFLHAADAARLPRAYRIRQPPDGSGHFRDALHRDGRLEDVASHLLRCAHGRPFHPDRHRRCMVRLDDHVSRRAHTPASLLATDPGQCRHGPRHCGHALHRHLRHLPGARKRLPQRPIAHRQRSAGAHGIANIAALVPGRHPCRAVPSTYQAHQRQSG